MKTNDAVDILAEGSVNENGMPADPKVTEQFENELIFGMNRMSDGLDKLANCRVRLRARLEWEVVE